jgi:phosphinothricin acetyltransferase
MKSHLLKTQVQEFLVLLFMQKNLQKENVDVLRDVVIKNLFPMTILHKMLPKDWEAVKQIYEEGIATVNATFQQQAPDWHQWNNDHLQHSRIVAKDDGIILGWAALTGVSGRCVYAGVAEVSVYVSDKARGKGVGKQLLQKLIEESEANNIWTLQAGIFLKI